MAAEQRKWYRGMMCGEDNYLFTIPMSNTEANIFFDILSRARKVYDGGYSPHLDMDMKGYDTPDDFGESYFDYWPDFYKATVISIGKDDKPMIFKDEQDDQQCIT